MTWSVEAIEKDWIGGPMALLAFDAAEVVAAFCRVEDHLGRSWLQQAHMSGGNIVFGPAPTIRVVAMGKSLAALDGVPGSNKLIKKIRSGDASAEAELVAIHILRRSPDTEVELEPAVGTRVADFRVRQKKGLWTYIEVTFPDWAETTKHATRVMDSVASLVQQIKSSFALEVVLHSEPNEEELAHILAAVTTLCSQEGQSRAELPDGLGFLLLNATTPGLVVMEDHGEELRPRLGVMKAIGGQEEPYRHIAVRMAYSGQRAATFLDSEAVQLPRDTPGLVMIAARRAPGSMKDWELLLKRQFPLQLHTQVSGICLFAGGMLATPKGVASLLQTKLLVNPTAKSALPDWLATAVVDAGTEYEQISNPKGHTR